MNNPEKSFKKFLLLWSGELISAIGSGLTSFGLGVYVFQQTGKASAMALAGSVGKIIGTGSGRGTGFLIIIAGVLVCVTSVILNNVKLIKKLENGGDLCIIEYSAMTF